MKSVKLLSASLGAGLLGLTLTASAQTANNTNTKLGPIDSVEDLESVGKMLFKLADTNNDNMISQKEAVDAGNLIAGGFFFRADTNGDGKVTHEEVVASREDLFNQRPLLRFLFQRGEAEVKQQAAQEGKDPQKLNLMNNLDTDRDGVFSATELRQGVQTGVQGLFITADKNGDGQLDPAEVNNGVLEIGKTAVQTAFNAADTDNNGAVSQAEFDKAIINPAHVLFRVLDANNDNQISADELRSGTQILIREVQSMRVPEPRNSLSNRLQNPTPNVNAPAAAAPAPVVAPSPGTVPPQQ